MSSTNPDSLTPVATVQTEIETVTKQQAQINCLKKQLSENKSSLQFIWNVEGDLWKSFKSADYGLPFYSDVFSMCGAQWKLQCYPKGESKEANEHVSLYLFCTKFPQSHNALKVNYLFTIGDDLLTFTHESLFEDTTVGWGRSSLITNNQLESLESLKITCIIQWSMNDVNGFRSRITSIQKDKATEAKQKALEMELDKYKNNAYLRSTLVSEDEIQEKIGVDYNLLNTTHEYDALLSKHECMLDDWNENTNLLNDIITNNDDNCDASLLEQYIKSNALINAQSNRLSKVTTDDYLMQLLKKQNELQIQTEKRRLTAEDTKKQLNQIEKQYESKRDARRKLQILIEEQMNTLNEMIEKENELLMEKQTTQLTSDAQKDEISQFKSLTEKSISLINNYNDFIQTNKVNIDKANSYFKEKWNNFENNFNKWTSDECVAWFKYKTQSMNTSNIEWNGIKEELIKQNICGKSLNEFSENALYMLGLHDFGIRNFIFRCIVKLRSNYCVDANMDDDDKENEMECPEKFICPITKKLMSDPVIAFDTYSYEREAIETYLQTHNKSPITNASAFTTILFPNVSLKQEILFNQTMVVKNGQEGVESDDTFDTN